MTSFSLISIAATASLSFASSNFRLLLRFLLRMWSNRYPFFLALLYRLSCLNVCWFYGEQSDEIFGKLLKLNGNWGKFGMRNVLFEIKTDRDISNNDMHMLIERARNFFLWNKNLRFHQWGCFCIQDTGTLR